MADDKTTFDVFISFKSEDEKYAYKIFEFLQQHGFNPFFSTISVSFVGQSQYLKSIAKAISQCRHMVVVASKPEYIISGWVEYEWSIYIARRNDKKTEGNLLTLLTGDMTVSDLPQELVPFQSIPLTRDGLEEMLQFLDTVPGPPTSVALRHKGLSLAKPLAAMALVGLCVAAGFYAYEKTVTPRPTMVSHRQSQPSLPQTTAPAPSQKKTVPASAQASQPANNTAAVPAATPTGVATNASLPAPTPAKTWTEPRTGMTFVWIPGECYPMGNPLSQEQWRGDEGPVHTVCVDGFWLGKTEVTRGQFAKFVGATGYKTDAEKQGWSLTYNGKWKKIRQVSWKDPGFPQTEEHPVVHVSKVDAKAMMRWLSASGAGTFLLPTEAQWEYACRARNYIFTPWGDTAKAACGYANIYDQAGHAEILYAWEPFPCNDRAARTAPVARYAANPFGLDDMLGNVFEWTDDRHGWYDPSKQNNPQATAGDGYVIRGGAWNSGQDASCVRRENLGMEIIRADNLGFRLVRKAP
ncbi:protein of unknown function DUF323 [Solidesulfovibrio fructosivorans JJ]]|uniref:TIR domain-containing protein n=1 Tax=Solidesulfovibrio fructosivorans JJ] TaxID=596151 RepID=E1K250_SOLFR|nr:SUMF1/EgtB/PvdO family nonheme iron enzyme [Solidesulfovibrio fructosivorans]EFL49303.1 protein of unknown function DUF323 [Solidesulfovibrio fructosivorans JJ]]